MQFNSNPRVVVVPAHNINYRIQRPPLSNSQHFVRSKQAPAKRSSSRGTAVTLSRLAFPILAVSRAIVGQPRYAMRRLCRPRVLTLSPSGRPHTKPVSSTVHIDTSSRSTEPCGRQRRGWGCWGCPRQRPQRTTGARHPSCPRRRLARRRCRSGCRSSWRGRRWCCAGRPAA